jgi:transposase
MQNFIGIDVSKKDFFACFNEHDEAMKFNNNKQGINKFIRHLNKNNYQNSATQIGLESTGAYHLPLSLLCTQGGYPIKVINPLITKKQNQTDLRRVKNDKKDSRLIRYCLTTGAGYEFHETNESLILKNLVRQRNYLSDLRVNLKIKQQDIEYKEKYLEAEITPINQELSLILEEKIKVLDKELLKYRPETQKLLRSIPGVGPISAVSFVSEIGDIKRFKESKQLVAYIGLDPRTYESGTSVKGKGYITKRGNKILRTRLYNACSVAVLRPNMFQSFFQKKRSEGKPYRVALCAVMNKMVHVVFAVWQRGTPYIER